MSVDVFDYTLTTTSTPWKKDLGNPSISSGKMNLTGDDIVTRTTTNLPRTEYEFDLNVLSANTSLIFQPIGDSTPWRYPSIRVVSGITTLIGGAYSYGFSAFGTWNGIAINSPTRMKIRIDFENKKIRAICNNYDSGVVSYGGAISYPSNNSISLISNLFNAGSSAEFYINYVLISPFANISEPFPPTYHRVAPGSTLKATHYRRIKEHRTPGNAQAFHDQIKAML